MTEDSPRRLVVGRLRKPHGLKGECTVFPLTNDPDLVFAKGRSVWLVDLNGEVVKGPLVVDRSRAYHREWLVAFEGCPDRNAIEGWRDLLLAAPADTLRPPDEDEVYLHELTGFAVVDGSGEGLGVVTRIDELPTGLLLEVQGKKREFLLPFRKEFVTRVDRAGRQLVVDLPEGLVE
ncbi:MAG: ribosome maturation factor RimM [Gemmatimonadales bacterium]